MRFPVRQLTKDEFIATFVEPMRGLEAHEVSQPVHIGAYVDECIRTFDLPVTRAQLQIQHVYLNGDETFYHVLIHYGRQNEFLVIVVDGRQESVHGYYVLDLNGEYGLEGAPA